MAVGADQGGSIRNPAGRCGIVGLKPTLGLVPYTGIVPMEFSLDHVGLMAKTVHDVALLLEVGIFGKFLIKRVEIMRGTTKKIREAVDVFDCAHFANRGFSL